MRMCTSFCLPARRFFWSVALLAMAACAPAPPQIPAAAPDASDEVLTLSNAIVEDSFEQYPERPTMLRVPGASYSRLPNDTVLAAVGRRVQYAKWLARLQAIDASSLREPVARLTYAVARGRVEDTAGIGVCRSELWTVSQLNGWQVRFANLAQLQPVGTDDLRTQALQRAEALPSYIDTQIVTLRGGSHGGYKAAAVNVGEVVQQMDALLALPPEKSPFFDPARRDGDKQFQAQLGQFLKDSVYPAMRRYRDFLRDEYLTNARSDISVAAIPEGAACYRALLRYSTTLDLDPESVHAEGWTQLAAIDAEMAALSARSFGGAPVPELLQRFKSSSQYRYRDAKQMIALAQTSMDRAWAALPQAFGLLPTSPAVIEPIPAFQERTAAPHYLPAALDGSRPATYRIRLYEPKQQSTVIGESTAYHEVVPGHHLQINIANQRQQLPSIARFLSNSGFSEGWGLYAERLADELGLYTSDADRFGMLSNFAWRAVRMIVDTGIHAKGWDRQKAIDLLLAHTALSAEQAAAEVDRYIAWPGQAPSYYLGYLEIRRLRAEAEQRLGSRFDLRAFHDQVLENGNVSLPVLRERVEAWIKTAAPS